MLVAVAQFALAISHDLYWVDDASDAKTVMQGTSLTFTYETYTTAGVNFGEDHRVRTQVKLHEAHDSANALQELFTRQTLYNHSGDWSISTSSLPKGDYVIHGVAWDLDDVRNGEPRKDGDILYFTVLEPNVDPSVATVFIKPDEPYTTDDLKGYCKANDPDAGDIISYNGQWIRNGEFYKSASLDNQQAGKTVVVDTLSSDLTKVGEQWVFACQASDGVVTTAYVYSDPVTIRAVPVPNTAPVISSVSIDPSNPDSAQDIAGFCKPYDADGDSLSITYQWLKNGLDYSGVQYKIDQQSGSTVSLGGYSHLQTAAGDTWTLKCQAFDGQAYSDWKSVSVFITDANTAPVVQSVYGTPNPAYENQDIAGYCKIADEQQDNLRYIWAWYKNGQVIKNGIEGPFAFSAYQNTRLLDTLSASETSAGDIIEFACQAYDSNLYSAEVKSDPIPIKAVVIPNKAPSMEQVYIQPSQPHNDNDLKGYCQASDSDDAYVSYEYRWLKNGEVMTKGSVGQFTQGQTVLVSDVDAQETAVGDKWQLQCQAFDGEDKSDWMSSAVVQVYEKVVPNKAPVMKTAEIVPAHPFDNQDLSAFCKASDANGDKLQYEYVWYKDESQLSSGKTTFIAHNTRYKVSVIDDGATAPHEQWKIACRAFDGKDRSAWLTSNIVTIKPVIVPNNEPVMKETFITPASPYDNQNLVGYCRATDADGDHVSFKFEWYQNGQLVTQGTTITTREDYRIDVGTVSAANTNAGDTWLLRCQAFDGEDYSSWMESDVVVIKEVIIPNKAPVMKQVYITPQLPYTDHELEAFCKASDADGDALSYEFVWSRDGVAVIQGETNSFPQGTLVQVQDVDAYQTAAHEVWQVKCRAFDGEDYSDWKSAQVTIQELIIPNKPPIMLEVDITPNSPDESQNLQGMCKAADADSTEVFYDVVWLRNGNTLNSYTVGPFVQDIEISVGEISKSLTTQGDVWQLGCRADDGEANTPWMYSDEVVIRDDGCLDAPVAKLDGPSSALVDETKVYDAYNSLASRCGAIESYTWKILLPTGEVSYLSVNEPTIDYEFLLSGTYTISVKVTDSEGMSDIATKQVVVTEPYVPSPTAVITAPSVVQAGTDFLVSGKDSFAPQGEYIVSYEWLILDGDDVLVDTYSGVWDTYTFEEGSYTFSLTVTASNGESDTASHTVLVTRGEEEQDERGYNGLRIVSYTLYGHDFERVAPGETLLVRVKVQNTRNSDIEDLRMSFIEPEFGLRYKTGAIDLDAGESDTFVLKIDVPHYMEYGYYYPALSFTSKDVKRLKYGYVEVTEAQ